MARPRRVRQAGRARAQALAQVQKRHPRGLPLLDPEEDLRIDHPAFRKAQRCAAARARPQRPPRGAATQALTPRAARRAARRRRA